jgi:hypothetical protein
MEDLMSLKILERLKKFTIQLKRMARGLKKDEMYKHIVGFFNFFIGFIYGMEEMSNFDKLLHNSFGGTNV